MVDPGSPGEWELPPDEEFGEYQCMDSDAPTPQLVADRIASVEANILDQWLAKHKHSEFVPASRGEARSTKSKFEGFKPGWAFKRGHRGLGYYRDYGGIVVAVSLAKSSFSDFWVAAGRAAASDTHCT